MAEDTGGWERIVSAYRVAHPRSAPAPRASWWQNVRRLARVNRRRRYHLTFAAGLRWLEALAACSIFWAILRSAWTFMSTWPEPSC